MFAYLHRSLCINLDLGLTEYGTSCDFGDPCGVAFLIRNYSSSIGEVEARISCAASQPAAFSIVAYNASRFRMAVLDIQRKNSRKSS